MGDFREIHGDLVGTGRRFALIVSRFNDLVTEKLLGGAIDCLVRHGVAREDLLVVRVPGAFELPLAARRAAAGDIDAVVALGCLIRGATPHFEHISSAVTKSLMQVGLDADVPVSFGVLTTDTLEQALERAGSKAGNKGAEAALAALEMAGLLPKLSGGGATG